MNEKHPALTGTDYLSIAEGCAHVQAITGQKVRPSTNAFWRWERKGIKARSGERVKLRHVRIGGKIYTRPDWIEQFLNELADADAEHFDAQPERSHVRVEPERTKRTEHDQARARLQASGLL